ncbi:LiaI-LiaF-like domain-containing protein [Hydrogenophaga aquatica]
MKNQTTAIALILLGTYFLLSNLGFITVSIREIIGVWWPLVLIAVGVSWLISSKR